jgi:hypothetical protein
MMTTGKAENDETDAGEAMSRSEAFDLLSSHRRRYALHMAKQAEGSLELSDIAEQVAAWENEKEPKEVTSDERHRVYTSLQQTHLPAMDDAGVIEYDNGTVTLTDRADDVEIYLDIVPENSIPWGVYYLGLAIFSGGLIAAAGLGLFPDVVPDIAWGAVVVVVLLGSAAYHVWQNQRMRLGAGDAPPEIDIKTADE